MNLGVRQDKAPARLYDLDADGDRYERRRLVSARSVFGLSRPAVAALVLASAITATYSSTATAETSSHREIIKEQIWIVHGATNAEGIARCPRGFSVMGGGVDGSRADANIHFSRPTDDGRGWMGGVMRDRVNTGDRLPSTIYAVCESD